MERKANLLPEIIEAIHLMYEDYPDVELDCVLFLQSLSNDHKEFQGPIAQWFVEHDRCKNCGYQLQFYTYQEPHPELDGCPMETLTETFCPKCEGGDTI